MNKVELRLEAIKSARLVNSILAEPYDRVKQLICDAQHIFKYMQTGDLPKQDEVAHPLQGGS